MITPRENYLISVYGGKPQWVPDFWEDVNMLNFNKYEMIPTEDGLMKDYFGITYMGNMPAKHKYWDDISDWRKYSFPDLTKIDWEAEAEWFKQIIDPTKLIRLDLGNHGLFQIAFEHMGVWLDLQELHDIGILDDFFVFWLRLGDLYLSCNRSLVLAEQQPLVVHGVDLPLQLADTPCGFCTFLGIKRPFFLIGDPHQQPIMGLAQFARQCVANWEHTVELPHILQICNTKPFSKLGG